MNRIQSFIQISIQTHAIVFASPELIYRTNQLLWPSQRYCELDVKAGKPDFEDLLNFGFKCLEIKLQGTWHQVYAHSLAKIAQRIERLVGDQIDDVRVIQ